MSIIEKLIEVNNIEIPIDSNTIDTLMADF